MRRLTCGAATLLAVLAMAGGTASAAPVTVGSPLTQAFAPTAFSELAIVANTVLAEPSARATSPVAGVVVEWHVLGAAGGPFTLRVLRPQPGGFYLAAGTSAPAAPTGLGLQTFPALVPIKAGDLVGLEPGQGGDKIGTVSSTAGAAFAAFKLPFPDGSTAFPLGSSNREVAFNAVVKPAPVVTAVSPKSGSFKGGTKVTITGTDLSGASAVSFGGAPAKSFTVDSETQITAVTAAAKKPDAAAVAVTTVAGTATVAGFKLTACVVPNLKSKKLEAAKKKLKSAGCKVGKVTKTNGVSAKTGKVTKQGKKAGNKLAPGTKINVTLG
ncbi:MAG TPA: IPT/TIG domain-containing protein [Solirubrobacterales bacterium]|nr:IPT/TIG domain-containing protein [Solirubrobacterales bacterium]